MSSHSLCVHMSVLISSPLIPTQWYFWYISLPRCGQKEEMRKEIKDLNKACWKEWNAVWSLSRAIWSWMSLWCNSCLKWPFVHLFRHRPLQTGSTMYAHLTSEVGLVFTKTPFGYPGFFLKCRGYFSVLPWYLGGLGSSKTPCWNPYVLQTEKFQFLYKKSSVPPMNVFHNTLSQCKCPADISVLVREQ